MKILLTIFLGIGLVIVFSWALGWNRNEVNLTNLFMLSILCGAISAAGIDKLLGEK